jgi:hypothetical protein
MRWFPPNPGDYWAEWKESGGGTRKLSKNLWVYESETSRKRYSITTSAGAKIQPYFDVPPPNDPNLYYFRVQGEEFEGGLIRVWITPTTALVLRQILGNTDVDTVSLAIINAAQVASREEVAGRKTPVKASDLAEPMFVTAEAYQALTEAFAGVSDEHMIQLFIRSIAR